MSNGEVKKNKIVFFDEKKFIYAAKAFAIFSVLCAHSTIPVKRISNYGMAVQNAADIINMLGIIGVPVFFILSGYLFSKNRHTLAVFWKRKLVSIFIPWVVMGNAVYFVQLYFGERTTFTVSGYLLYLIGVRSYFYYLLNLCLFYLIFWKIKNPALLKTIIAAGILSIILTTLNILPKHAIWGISVPYVNFFNWIAFFTIGVCIKTPEHLARLGVLTHKYIIHIALVLFSILFLAAMSGAPKEYWTKWSLLIEISGSILVFGLCTSFLQNNSLICNIGKMSLTIFLLNEPVCAFLMLCTKQCINVCTEVTRPLISLVIFITSYYFLKWIEGKNNLLKYLEIVVGLR